MYSILWHLLHTWKVRNSQSNTIQDHRRVFQPHTTEGNPQKEVVCKWFNCFTASLLCINSERFIQATRLAPSSTSCRIRVYFIYLSSCDDCSLSTWLHPDHIQISKGKPAQWRRNGTVTWHPVPTQHSHCSTYPYLYSRERCTTFHSLYFIYKGSSTIEAHSFISFLYTATGIFIAMQNHHHIDEMMIQEEHSAKLRTFTPLGHTRLYSTSSYSLLFFALYNFPPPNRHITTECVLHELSTKSLKRLSLIILTGAISIFTHSALMSPAVHARELLLLDSPDLGWWLVGTN